MKVLGLVGCGFLGGSFARASKAAACFDRVLGRDTDSSIEQQAISLNVIDGRWEPNVAVDAICVAVPTCAIAQVVTALWAEVPSHVPIFDVGSVKSSVLNELGDIPSNFVPCHPIAGSHKSGPAASDRELFLGSVCVISPTPSSDERIFDQVRNWWGQVGARVVVMPAQNHDRALAITSHLPHLVSFAAVELLQSESCSAIDLVGSGFRDFSRTASADATMWRSIFVDNLDNLRLAFQALHEHIECMLRLAESDPDGLERKLRAIATFRGSMNEQ